MVWIEGRKLGSTFGDGATVLYAPCDWLDIHEAMRAAGAVVLIAVMSLDGGGSGDFENCAGMQIGNGERDS